MGHPLFKHIAERDAEASEFAVTVVSIPYVETGPCPLEDVPDDLPETEQPAGTTQPTLASIGRYALKQQIGQGGLGTVFEAWDPLLSRTVAVKTLQFDIDTPTRTALDALFLNEARAAAGLSHAHIVTVHDAGLSAHGVYIAMERLRGRDLRQALLDGWRPRPAEAALLVRRVADALAYAHARGVVHCDIKPANIFLTRRGKPKVLDFGIARVAHHAALPALEGVIAGSPYYQAPEQWQPGATVDARTDIHALGAVLYELLAGRRAFEGDSLEQIRDAAAQHEPVPPHALCADVPPELSAIALRAMARDPDARYATAHELAQALRLWLAQQAQPAGSPGPATGDSDELPAPPSRRGPLLIGLAVAAALAVAAIAAWPPAPPVAASPAAADAQAAPTAAAEKAPPPSLQLPPPAPATTEPTAAAPAVDAPSPPPATAAPKEKVRKPVAAKPPVAAHSPTVPAAPPPRGVVNIAISPWGQVEVDGVPMGTTPPLSRLELPAGEHTITVRNEDFPPHTQRVQVDPERPLTLKHRFGP